jgi:hypothetical protein
MLSFPALAGEQSVDNKSNILDYLSYHESAALIDSKAHEISLNRLIELSSWSDTVIIDLRPREAYEQGHIKGALHLGADIDKEKLSGIAPSRVSAVILYCSNSLMPVRMMSLTDLSLPQFINLGYEQVYMLEPLWHDEENILDGIELLRSRSIWIDKESD